MNIQGSACTYMGYIYYVIQLASGFELCTYHPYPRQLVCGSSYPEEVRHCMLPYIRDQILELAKDRLLVAVL